MDGHLLVWGRGKYGALGLGNYLSVSTPQHVRGTSLRGQQVQLCVQLHPGMLAVNPVAVAQ